jgi:hypothetical protein
MQGFAFANPNSRVPKNEPKDPVSWRTLYAVGVKVEWIAMRICRVGD